MVRWTRRNECLYDEPTQRPDPTWIGQVHRGIYNVAPRLFTPDIHRISPRSDIFYLSIANERQFFP